MGKVTYVSIAVAFALVLLGFLLLSGSKKATYMNSERFYVNTPPTGGDIMSQGIPPMQKVESVGQKANASATPDAAASGIGDFKASDPTGNEVFNPVGTSSQVPSAAQPNCFPRDRLSSEDLLPKDAANNRWAQMNPAGQGDVKDQNYLTAGYHIGINTVGQSLRNANLQLRSEPVNPQIPVSPWNISTIEPDVNRRPLEIGGDF
jgi:hypothetical protein